MSPTYPRPDAIPAKIQTWSEHLLKDMTHLPKVKGDKPGRIVVQGHNAAPILKGMNNEHVVMAAAEVGDERGRIVVFSHDEYGREFGRTDREQIAVLHANVNNWLTKGKPVKEEQIVNLENIECHTELNSADSKILLWHSQKVPPKEVEQRVIEHVMGGGALVYALCSHSWKSNNPRKEMAEIPLAELLSQAGIAFSHNKVAYNHPSQGFSVASCEPSTLHKGHAQYLIQECLEDTDADGLFEKSQLLLNYLTDVPHTVIDHLKENLEDLFRKCHEIAVKSYPQPDMQVTDKLERAALVICNLISGLGLGYKKMLGIEHFPGDLEDDVEAKCAELEFKSTVKEAHETGFWVPAGTSLEIEVISYSAEPSSEAEQEAHHDDHDEDDSPQGWMVRIGAHSDKLHENNYLYRWPHLMIKVPLKSRQKVFTPYGGLLYFMSPEEKSNVKLKVTGVVEAPYFNLKDPQTVRDWETIRQKPGLWADISGEWFRITVPSSAIRDLQNPAEVMRLWDKVILGNHDLRGTAPTRREWLVADIQPVKGLLHSGYPIVSGLNVAEPDGALSVERLTTLGCWGIFHELGHNVQRGMWTFEGTMEVTCNIFSLYQSEMTAKIPVWLHPWFEKHTDTIKLYLLRGPSFEKWQRLKGVGLCFYAQLAANFGWDSYKKVFRGYEAIPQEQRVKNNVKVQVDEWVVRFSTVADYNLSPMAEFWGIPVSEGASRKLMSLKPFLPDDEMTRMAPDRVKSLEEKYPGLVRQVNKE